MAAEDVQDHLLTTWSFISQFGDVLGLFPRRQKNESDSETDDDIDEERVVTKPSTAQSGKANGSKTKLKSKKGSKISSDEQNSEDDVELEKADEAQNESTTMEDDSDEDEDLELNFENEDALIEGLETSPSEYETSADEEDAENDIHPPEGVLAANENIEALSIEKLSVILRNPKNASLEDRAWLDAVHTRMLRALLHRVSESAEYEDETDTENTVGILRRSVNVLTWPDILRQYLYLLLLACENMTKRTQRSFQQQEALKCLTNVPVNLRRSICCPFSPLIKIILRWMILLSTSCSIPAKTCRYVGL